jgi:hypothetical protein
MRTPVFPKANLRQVLRAFLLPIAVIATCICATPAFGQTNSSWKGGTGSWSHATNWTPSQVPNNGGGNTYNVTIDSGGTDTVTLDQNATITSLTLGGLTGMASLSEFSKKPETLAITNNVTVNQTGLLDLESGSTVTVSGNLTNSGMVTTNNLNFGGPANTLTVAGTFTNNGTPGVGTNNGVYLGENDRTGDVVNIGTLVNNGFLDIFAGVTLNLTNQPQGITSVVAGSTLIVGGTLNAGSNNGLANLTSVQGCLNLDNAQSTAITPGAGTLTVGASGGLDIVASTSVTVSGNLTNSGTDKCPEFNPSGIMDGGSLTVSGTLTNNAGATFAVGGALNLMGPLVNDGAIAITSGGEMIIEAPSVTLSGKGNVTLTNATITASAASDVLVNENTIEGYGMIGNGSMGLINKGLIDANARSSQTNLVLTIDPSSAGFSNQGTLEVYSPNGQTAGVATLDITGPANSFLNFNSSTGTLTGGGYVIQDGTLKFDNANIITNDANITLTGTLSKITDQNGNNALTNFATNGSKGTFTVNSETFTDANVFTNSGTVAAGAGGKFDASNQLTNFDSSTSTLTGGSFILTATGQLQFNDQGDSSDIVTNAAHITLSGVDTTKNSIIDQTGANALQNFDTNAAAGSLTLVGDRQFTTTGQLTNAGTITIEKSTGTGTTALIIGGTGSFIQTGGTMTVDGKLTTSVDINIEGGFVYGNAGTLTGDVSFTGGTINPGDGLKKIGALNISGSYTQSGAGILNIDLDGTSAGKFDVLNVSGAASLGGTLDVDAIAGFTPTSGETFDILNTSAVTGTFSTVNCSFSNGDSCSVTYNASDVVVTITGGAVAKNGAVSSAAVKAASKAFAGAPGTLAASAREPVAILARATCFARLIGTAPCDSTVAAISSHGSEPRADTGVSDGEVHNNIMVATRSISSERGNTSHGTSASATAMARLYVCAYLPSGVAHTMGCN